MDTVGPWELLIVVVVVVALFGAERLPRIARNLGEGIREFRAALREGSQPTANQEAGPAGPQAGGPGGSPAPPGGQPSAPSR